MLSLLAKPSTVKWVVQLKTRHLMSVMLGVPKGCNKEFLWACLLPDACSINSPSESQLCSVGLWSGLSYRRPVRGTVWRRDIVTGSPVTPGPLIGYPPPALGRRPARGCDWLL